MLKSLAALILVLKVISVSAVTSPPCESRARAVIDLGSGSVKLDLAEVEICAERSRFIRALGESVSRPLPLEASKDKQGKIPEPMQIQAVTILREFRDQAMKSAKAAKFDDLEISVVGTHAYRTAQNQEEFQTRIEAAGFKILALTQKDEAQSGLFAVQTQGLPAGCDPSSLLVWDIGGGSMQLIRSVSPTNPSPRIEGFNMGAESFKQALMGKFKAAKTTCSSPQSTPNPIGKNESEAVRTFARDTSQRLLRTSLRSALRATCVVGIGGVHSKAVTAQLEKSWDKVKDCVCKDSIRACSLSKQMYHKVHLECLARHLSEKSDCDAEIQGPYSTTAVSNLYFVLGWMDRLGIERVHTRAVNMGKYLVLDRELLTFAKVNLSSASAP